MLMHTYIGSGPINRRGNQDLSMNNYEFPLLHIRNRCLGTGEASKKAHFRGFSKRSVPASVPSSAQRRKQRCSSAVHLLNLAESVLCGRAADRLPSAAPGHTI